MRPRLVESVGRALTELTDRPWTLLAFALLLDALFHPYIGLDHDAGLYAFQTLNRVTDGEFDGDLFFRHGSQDEYSLFSRVMAPLAGAIGLGPAFFLGFLLSKALYLWAGQRLCLTLIGRNPLGVLAALLFAIDLARPDPGFATNEAFLTPRLPAIACGLLALERMLHRKWITTTLLLGLAFALHPLMAVGPALVAVAWVALTSLSARSCAAIAVTGLIALAFTLAHEPTGSRLFGHVDAAWFDTISRSNRVIMVNEWPRETYVPLTATALVLAGFARWFPSAEGRRFAFAVLFVSACGLALSQLATQLPYALLLQGQPYRALRVMFVVLIPASVWCTAHLWERDTHASRTLAALLVLAVGLRWWTPAGTMLTAFIGAAWLALSYLGRSRHPRWVARAAINTVVTGMVIRCVMMAALLAYSLVAFEVRLMPHEWARELAKVPDLLSASLVGAALLLWLTKRGERPVRLRWAFPAALAIQTTVFALPNWYARSLDPDWADERFVAGLSEPGREPPTVYWPAVSHPARLWLEAGSRNYFHVCGNGSALFRREAAVELARRVELVTPFELYHYRACREGHIPEPALTVVYERFFDAGLDDPAATLEPDRTDLERLCSDLELDWVVLRVRFPELAVADNGTWYAYDAAAIRQSCSKIALAQTPSE